MARASGPVGRYIPISTAGYRPLAARELAAYGGARLFRGRRVLDIGTGDGRLALGAARWARSVVGIDPDASVIAEAKRSARQLGLRNVRFVQGPAQELPFRRGAFDVVVLAWVL